MTPRGEDSGDDHVPPGIPKGMGTAHTRGAVSREPAYAFDAAGKPIGIEPGFYRSYDFYPVNLDDLKRQIELYSTYERIARDAGACHSGFSPDWAIKNIWCNLPPRTKIRSDAPELLWLDLVFELAWQNIPGSPLRASKKKAWQGNRSVAIDAIDAFNEFPIQLPRFESPPRRWFSVIDDIFGASVAAIDIILSLPSSDDAQNDAAITSELPAETPQPLTERESNILEALGDRELTGEALAAAAGYTFNSAFRQELSNMKKRGLLTSGAGGRGYRRACQ